MNHRPSAIKSGKWKVESRCLCFLLCTFCFLLPAGGQNLIKNGDFEEPLGPDNWTVVYTGVLGGPAQNRPTSCGPEDFMVQDRTTMAHKDRVIGVWDGNYSGGHFRANSDWLMHAYFKQTVTNLIPGSNYIVKAWMSQFDLEEKVQVYLEVMGGLAGAFSCASTPLHTNVWKSHSVTNSASASGQIEVRLHYNRNEWAVSQKWRNIDAFYDHVSVMTSTQAPPVIVTQPISTNICLGDAAVLAVSATGSGLTYQWYYNTYTRIIGATNATLTIPNAQSSNTGYYSVDVSNGYEVTSSNALLRVGTTITRQPSGTNICSGAGATFSVAAYGVGTVLYQWQKNGTNLSSGGHYSGATTTTLTVTSADINDAANYSCVVTSACGNVTSSVVGLVLSGANITQQPSDASAGIGCTASFAVAGTGCGALTYQWQKNQTNLNNGGHYSGCTTATLTVSGIDGNDQASYRCAVTDGLVTTYSTNATLTMTTDCAPCGLQNGDFEGGNVGGVASGWTGYQRAPNPSTVWSIETASPPTGGGLQYQQILNTSSTGGAGVRQNVIGCTIGATYNVSGWMRGNSANATCTVKCSPAGSTDWSTAIDLDTPQTYTGSDWTTFSGNVVATGTTMTVWLDGQTGGTGQNDAECFDSVTVTCAAPPPPPDITQQPIATNICPGATATFTVAATGLGTLTYQWQRNQDDLSDGGHYSGTTTPTLTVANASSGDAADYRCVVTYAGSSTNSDEVTLTLKAVTAITEQPLDQTVNPGGTASFSVTVTGADTLTYQWQTNGVNLSNNSHYGGVTSATLWVTNVSSADVVNYRCLVAGGCGSVTSSLAMVAINTCNPGRLLQNSDFEGPFVNWSSDIIVATNWINYSAGNGTAKFYRETTTNHSGSAAQYTKNINGANGSLLGVRQTMDANVGDAFTFEGWVYQLANLNNAQTALAVRWDGTTANPDGTASWEISPGPRNDWAHVGNLSGNATATTVTLFLDSRRISGSIDISAYWDDVVCYRAFVPPAPAITGAGITSLQVNVTPGCNWTNGSAEYAITIGGGAYTLGTHWVQADGSVGTTAVWQTDATWATTAVTGLWGGTTYTLKVQARYSSAYTQATSLGAGAILTTDGPAPPTITQHPSVQNVCPNATAAFGVAASGGGIITYQWQKNNVDLANGGHYSGVMTANLTVSTADTVDAANYRCIVSNEGGSTPSSQAALTLKAATIITGEPSAQNVCPGANPTFSLTATGEGTLTYQWQTNGMNLSNNSHYGGCTNATLWVTNVGDADEVSYRCVVTAGCGSATSSAPALTVKAATVITSDPSVQNVCPGLDATFTVEATGDGTLTYQWQTNGVDVSDNSHYGGCTTATLWVTNTGSADAVNYRCVVGGGCGSANSGTAALTLRVATAIAGEPLAQNVCLGSNATFTVTATGEGTLTYQWRTNGVDLSDNSHYGGCMTASLMVTNTGSNDVANYACVVTAGCGSVTSGAPALTLKAATTITQQPSDQSVALSSNATFSVVATGDGTLAYQWRKNGSDLTNGGHYSGVMTAVLTVSGANRSDVGVYACEVSGGCGSVISSNGALSVSYGLTNDYAVNQAVPDASFTGVSDTRSISTAIHSVTNLKVRLKISGTYNGDLYCYLTHGSGYSVLLNRVGRRADSAFGYGDPGLEVTFDDGAANDVHNYRRMVTGNDNIPLGTNVMGMWVADGRTNRPTEVLDTDARPALLSRFSGMDPNGDWTVFVADVAGGDSHTLVSWGLEISGTEEPWTPPVATISGTVKLQAYLGSSRVVRFIASAVAGGVTNYLQTNDVNLSFTAGEADYSIDVPTNTTHLSAKTAWHLRKRLPVTFVDGAATNNFTGTDWLLGGDLVTAIGSTSIDDTDNLVNAVDLGLLLGYYLSAVGSDPLIGRADIDGDAGMDMVNAVDLSILLGNYLLPGDGP